MDVALRLFASLLLVLVFGPARGGPDRQRSLAMLRPASSSVTTAKTGVQINFIRCPRVSWSPAPPRRRTIRAPTSSGARRRRASRPRRRRDHRAVTDGNIDKIPAELKDTGRGFYTRREQDNTLIFMSNAKLLKEKGLKGPRRERSYSIPLQGQIQTADARTSGTALTRILSIYYAFGKRGEDDRLPEEAAQERAGLHEEAAGLHGTRFARQTWCASPTSGRHGSEEEGGTTWS